MKGRDLRQLRKTARITQSALRARLQWDATKIVKIENEDVLPTPEDEEKYVQMVSRMAEESPSEAVA